MGTVRRRGLVALVIGAGACTGGASDATHADGGAGNRDSGTKVPAQAIVSARCVPDEDTGSSEIVLELGDFPADAGPSRHVREGAEDGVDALSCSVAPDGSGAFLVHGRVDARAGQFEVRGTFAASGETSGVKARVSVPAGTYEASDCTVRYPQPGGVAYGRVWGRLACATAVDQAGNGCRLDAEFRFENCL